MRRNNVVHDSTQPRVVNSSFAGYQGLDTEDTQIDGHPHLHHNHDIPYAKEQFNKEPRRQNCVPYKAIVLACVLSLVGALLILVAMMLFLERIHPKYNDRTWPVFILGALMFIPGVYHMAIAYYAYIGTPGYSYEDIPDFD